METESIAVLIPLSAIILGISAGIVGIVSRHRQVLQRADLRHKERLAAIEKGLDLPPEAVDAETSRPRFLLRGLIWTFVGCAGYFTLGAVAGEEEATLACIPFAVGLAYLVYYFVEGRKEVKAAGVPPQG